MGRSQETYGKKEVRKKKEQKRKEKEQKRALKKSEGKKNSFDDMIAYVDEYGKITALPPDPDRITTVVAENIELGIPKNNQENTPDFVHKGVVSFFNTSKGYGFIRDLVTQKSIFVHANDLAEPIAENNVVIFEITKGAKGPAAKNVRKFTE